MLTKGKLSQVHPAWVVAGAGFVVLLAAAAFRAVPGVVMVPLQDEFGWSRATISLAVTINLVLFGISAPFAASLVERFGLRRVVCIALSLILAAACLSPLATEPWHLHVLWGGVAGAATGAVAPVLAAQIATRWFVAQRGLVTGLLTAANSTGQLVFLPAMGLLVAADWRWALAVVAGATLVALPVAGLLLRDRPGDVGRRPLGATEDPPPPGPRPAAIPVLREAARTGTFWALAGSFFVCGATTVGLIAVHLIPAAHDHGMSVGAAAGMLAVMGVLDIAGTTGSGWLTDRHDARRLLFMYYGFRGLSLMLLPFALAEQSFLLAAFVLFYGLDWIATVPPTVALCAQRFGTERAGVVFGWVFSAHQLGAAAAALTAGIVRDSTGTYDGVFVVSGLLCLGAAAWVLRIRRVRPGAPVPLVQTAPAVP